MRSVVKQEIKRVVNFESYYLKFIDTDTYSLTRFRMKISSLLLLLLLLALIVLCLFTCTVAQPDLYSHVCQDTFGNYTSNSTFGTNLKTLLSEICNTNKIDYGFYNFSVGKEFDIVNGIGLCQPDVLVDDCHECLQEAASAIVEQCPNQKDAIGWYEKCMIRYTDRYISGKMELRPWYHLEVTVFGTDNATFNHTAGTLLAKLQTEAASGDSRLKYGAGTVNITSSLVMYALVQCTPDLNFADCYKCLDAAIGFALTNLYGQRARVFSVSCNIRYETFPFYDSSTLISTKLPLPPQSPSFPPSPSTSSSRRSKGMSKKSKVLIIVLVPVITILLLLLAFLGCFFARRTKTQKKITRDEVIRNPEAIQMDFETIKVATDNFSPFHKLGQGGFGAVFKGKLTNGEEIAVKRLAKNSGQGEEEFKNEVVLVAKLRHRNLVRFLGFCVEGEERLLIYELLPNKSLDYFLFDPIKRSLLDWQTRYKIIGGIARGLLYLHEDSRLLVVHRDLKAGNILLDEEMNPKISDFGMARLFGVDQSRSNTSRICGTYGYMPPEYVQQGQFSIKSDVYSFGVLVLEIITGLRISSYFNAETGESLLSYAWRNWLEDTALNIVDTTMSVVDRAEVLRCINIGLLCVQEKIAHRPIMSSVILLLNSQYTLLPPMPSRPAFLLLNNYDDSGVAKAALQGHGSESEAASGNESRNEVSLSELDPR